MNINAGAEYAFVFGAAYAYQLRSTRPVILNAEFSMHAGNNLFDDHKSNNRIKELQTQEIN